MVSLEREWRAAGPALFAGLAVALLLYNHTQEQVTDYAFWIGLGLIGTTFVWLIQNNRRQSRLDPVTGLSNRLELHADLDEAVSSEKEEQTLILIELDGLGAYRDRLGIEAGDVLLRRFGRDLNAVVERLGGRTYRVEGGQFCALLPSRGRRPGELVMAVLVPVDYSDEETPIDRPYGEVSLPDEAGDADLALKIVTERLAAHKQRERRSAKRQALDALVAVLIARQPELEHHIRAVAFRAISIGRQLGLSEGPLDDVVSAAKLQNIGLTRVPDAVLEKPTELTPEESGLIRGHAVAGARIISSAPALASVAALVRSSCEHFDGSGYPAGLAGEAIPLGSRIVAVCVAYAALIAHRPYRPARTPGEALAEMRRCAGAQFDPEVVEALAEDLAEELSPPDSEVEPVRV
jgi:two-component system cell cycle response regulator